jgi:hypothetical protein
MNGRIVMFLLLPDDWDQQPFPTRCGQLELSAACQRGMAGKTRRCEPVKHKRKSRSQSVELIPESNKDFATRIGRRIEDEIDMLYKSNRTVDAIRLAAWISGQDANGNYIEPVDLSFYRDCEQAFKGSDYARKLWKRHESEFDQHQEQNTGKAGGLSRDYGIEF